MIIIDDTYNHPDNFIVEGSLTIVIYDCRNGFIVQVIGVKISDEEKSF
jgi:hypothetical protein